MTNARAFGMSPSETVEALVRRGVPRAAAEAQHGANPRRQAPTIDEPMRRVIAFPLSFTLPWTALVSDGDRLYPKGSRMFMQPGYREAREKIVTIVRRVIENAEPVAFPLALDARVYVPDNRIHDVPNFAKGVHDALKTYIYTDDRWLYRATWERIGVDPDAPRADILITRWGALTIPRRAS